MENTDFKAIAAATAQAAAAAKLIKKADPDLEAYLQARERRENATTATAMIMAANAEMAAAQTYSRRRRLA